MGFQQAVHELSECFFFSLLSFHRNEFEIGVSN